MHRSPHRYSRSENLLWFWWLSKLTDRPVNGANQISKLIWPQPMVPDIALDDPGRQMRIDFFGIHENTFLTFLQLLYTEVEGDWKMSKEHFG
jgi:hypothetical protein